MDAEGLKSVPLFSSLSEDARREFAVWVDELKVSKGKHLVDEGDYAYDLFVIEEGEAEVTRESERVADLGPGDFFGEIGVLAKDARRTASVVTTSSMRAIVMAAHELRVIANEMPEVAERLRAAIAERTKQLT